MCSSGSSFLFNPNNNNNNNSTTTTNHHHQPNLPPKMQHPNNTSSGSLNSSYIWREASPTNCNLYSASVSSLNTAYRYSLGHHNTGSPEWRPMAEDKTIWSNKKTFMAHLKNKSTTATNNENMYMTPLLPVRKHKQSQHIKVWNKSTAGSGGTVVVGNRVRSDSPTVPPVAAASRCSFDGLYDRRTNRSFEAPPTPDHKVGPLRRSTPHLVSDDMHASDSASRHSATWCCGNFVLKQWRKINNYD